VRGTRSAFYNAKLTGLDAGRRFTEGFRELIVDTPERTCPSPDQELTVLRAGAGRASPCGKHCGKARSNLKETRRLAPRGG